MPEAEATFPRAPALRTALTPPSGTDAAIALPPTQEPRRGRSRAVLVTLRPRQWIKNLLVIAAPAAAGALGHDDVPVRAGLASIAFCMLASGIYAVNDVRDAEEDRLHPRKRLRPVAAGELDPRAATAVGIALMSAGIVLCLFVRPLLAVVGGGYLALTLSYTLLWRHLLLLDIVAIAGGFVLRAVAGGVAAPVALSRWFLLVITCAAVFVAAGKRQAELRRTAADGGVGRGAADGIVSAPAAGRRRVLAGYSQARLRLILVTSAAATLFAYCVWAFELPAVHGFPWRPLTIVPFAICLLRYWTLLGAGDGEAPEELVLADRPLLLAGLAWVLLFVLGVNAAV
jgi:decaprenyl-phosphate phosphoribosyltransferase